MELSATEIKKRLKKWKAPKLPYTTGVFHKYAITAQCLGRGSHRLGRRSLAVDGRDDLGQARRALRMELPLAGSCRGSPPSVIML